MTDKTNTPAPEALRLAAWLQEGAWHQMRLGDVQAAGRELRRQHARIAELEAEIAAVGAGGVQRLSPSKPKGTSAEQAQAATKSIAHGGKITRYSDMSVLVKFPSCRQASAFEQAIQGEAPAGSGGWQAHAEAMERERDHWRERAHTMHDHQRGEVWYWQGDGGDNLQSLVNSLPVVIRADQLRQLVSGGVQALSAGPVDPSITLDFKQATELLAMFGGEPGIVTLQHGGSKCHSGPGLYAWYSDLPEEGAEFLGAEPDDEASPTPPAEQPVDPDGEAFRKAAHLGLTLRFYGSCAQSSMPGTPSAYVVTHGGDRAEAMRDAVQQAAEIIARGGEAPQATLALPAEQPAQPGATPKAAATTEAAPVVKPGAVYAELPESDMMAIINAQADAAFAPKGPQAAPKAAPGEPFQNRVQPWLLQCFGAEIADDTVERNHRFLEEALELVQSTGCTQSEAHQLVDYVFGRPVGEPTQEAGGVMVTLAALCLANGLDMNHAGETELARIWTKVDAIRAKQAAKPKHSPLPQAAPQQEAQEPDPATFALWYADHIGDDNKPVREAAWETYQAFAGRTAQPAPAPLLDAARMALKALDWLPTSDQTKSLWQRQQPALEALRASLAAQGGA